MRPQGSTGLLQPRACSSARKACTVGWNHASCAQVLISAARILIPGCAGRRRSLCRATLKLWSPVPKAHPLGSCMFCKFLGGHDSSAGTWVIYVSDCSRSFWGQGVVFAINPKASSPSFLWAANVCSSKPPCEAFFLWFFSCFESDSYMLVPDGELLKTYIINFPFFIPF